MDIGAVLFAAIGGVIIYIVFSAIGRVSNGNSKPLITWDEIITTDSSEFEKEAYVKLIKPFIIDASKFTAATLFFMGKPVDTDLITKGMDYWGSEKGEYDERFDFFYYCAFPDVLMWIVSHDINELVSIEIIFNEKGVVTVDSFKELVNQFRIKTGNRLEMASG